jgi:hypothetical protein
MAAVCHAHVQFNRKAGSEFDEKDQFTMASPSRETLLQSALMNAQDHSTQNEHIGLPPRLANDSRCLGRSVTRDRAGPSADVEGWQSLDSGGGRLILIHAVKAIHHGLVWGGGLGEGQLEGQEIMKLPWSKRTARQQDDLLDYFLRSGSIIDGARYRELKLGELRDSLNALKSEFPSAIRAPVMRARRVKKLSRTRSRTQHYSCGRTNFGISAEYRKRLAERAAGIEPETLRQICVFDPAELVAPDQEPDSAENR